MSPVVALALALITAKDRTEEIEAILHEVDRTIAWLAAVDSRAEAIGRSPYR